MLIAVTFLMITSSCKKEYLQNPTVTTTLVSKPAALTLDPSTVVTIIGNISDDVESAVTERGVCYNVVSLNATEDMRKEPTLDYCTQKIRADVTSKQFSIKVSVITSGFYILRAYAITRGGVVYGNPVNFQIGAGGAGVDAKALKSTQDEVVTLTKKVESIKDIIANGASKADLAAAKDALQKLIDGKVNAQALADATTALQQLIDAKASTQDLAAAKDALQKLIDGKVSTQALADATTALQLLIDAKASKQDLIDAKAALQLSIDSKASTQDLAAAKTTLQLLIDTKASTQDLTDAKAALQLLIDAKASQAGLNAATKRLSKIEEIIANNNPISSLGITALESNLVSVAITLNHISIDPNVTKHFSEIQKLEYVCFEANEVTPPARIPIPFDPNTVADNVTTVSVSQNIIGLAHGRPYKFIVYATMAGDRVHSGRTNFTSR